MKIQDYNIEMASGYSLKEYYEKSENLTYYKNYHDSISSKSKELEEKIGQGDTLELSDEAQKAMKDKMQFSEGVEDFFGKDFSVTGTNNNTSYTINNPDDLKLKLLEDFLRSILNKNIELKSPLKLNIQLPNSIMINSPINFQNVNFNLEQKLDGRFQYEFNESYSEKEKMCFKSSGVIHTSDGKEVNFNVNIGMSRSFYTQTNLTIESNYKPIDPLVINFDGEAAELTSTKFSFDLDSDGEEEQISALKKGSGFLALDLNGDGVINNGAELFGPSSGNGFKDLSQYDSDHNNWIDENDDIFNKLRIWTKDEEGNDKLFALGEKGIGAIYLGNIDSKFSIKDDRNKDLAQIEQTGIFVKENGDVGTVQQIDFIV